MVRAQDSLAVVEYRFVLGDGFLQPPGALVGVSKEVAGDQGVGVVRAQDSLAVVEYRFVLGDGFLQPPGLPVGQGKIVAGDQGWRMVGA